MRKFTTLIVLAILAMGSLMAQAPQKFTYQAVVRNTNNQLLPNTSVGVQVVILENGAGPQGNPIYAERHVATTNANGLVTLNIGEGNVILGNFSTINWKNGVFFLDIGIDPTGGSDYSIWSTQQLLSVPYALYANEAGNGFSGDYNDLSNKPTIPTVPNNLSAFTNDVGFITSDSIPTNVSAFTNNAGYLTSYTETDPVFNAWDKNYNDLTNKPTIPAYQILSIHSDTIFLTNGGFVKLPAGFDGNYNSLTNKPTIPAYQILSIHSDTIFLTNGGFVKLPVGFDGNYNSLTNKPNLFDGNYNSLTNKPNLAPVATSGNYNDLNNKPTIPAYQILSIHSDTIFLTNGGFVKLPAGFDGNYNSLTNKPTIPADQILSIHSDTIFLTNGGFVKLPAGFDGNYNSLTNKPNLFDGNYNSLTNKPNLAPVATSGNYNDLNNKPSIPADQILSIHSDTIFLTNGGFVKLPAGFDGNYNSLTNKPNLAPVATSGNYNDLNNKPSIPTVPNNLSAFNNDAGYITNYTETDPVFSTWDKDYNDLTNKPTIPTVPNNISAFNNDAGYITNYTETQTLANVTALGNSAGNRQLKDVADPTDNYDAVNLRSLTLMIDSAKNTMQQMQQQWLLAQQQWQETQQQWQIQQQQLQQQWQLQQTQLQQQIDSLTLILNSITADTAFSLWNTAVVNETACNAYEWHGETYTQSGIHLYGFTNTDGSHNIEALNLTIHAADTIHIPMEVCDSYTWNGTTYTESGDFYLRLTNQYGCDSLQILHLTLRHGTHNVEIDTACDNYTWHGGTYHESGIYTYNYTNEYGCESADTLHLTVYHGTHNVVTDTVCESYIWHDSTYTESGVYTFAYTNEHGCASVDSLKLTVHYGTHLVSNENACGSIEWHGQTYTESGTYSYGYNNEYGCPSKDTLKVVVVAVDEKSCPAAPCVTDIDGNMYRTVQIGDQCWMRSNLRVTHFPDGSAIPAGNTTSDTSPFYYNTPNSYYSLEHRGYLYNWKAVMHNQSSSTTDPSGVQGICPDGWHVPSDAEWAQLIAYVSNQSAFACEGNNAYYAKALALQTGWRTYSYPTTCVVGNDQNQNNATGFSAVPAGQYYGSYVGESSSSKFWTSSENSSSAYYYNLWEGSTILERTLAMKSYGFSVRCVLDAGSHRVESVSSCGSYEWHGETYTESGTYIYSYNNAINLPSTDTLKLTVYHGTHNVEADTACESYTWHGQTYTESGTYTNIYTNEDGCYSVDTLKLTVYPVTRHTETEMACESYTWHDSTYTISGTYTYVYNDENGCETVDTLKLTVLHGCTIDEKSCPGTPILVDFDNNGYSTVQIGNQCWMRNNLRTTHFADGTSIPFSSGISLAAPYYYDFVTNDFTLAERGMLYNWSAAMHSTSSVPANSVGVQGVCPTGWHVPSDGEWTQLINYVNSQEQNRCDGIDGQIAKTLAANTSWYKGYTGYDCLVGNNRNANNATGFSIVPAGSLTRAGNYDGQRYNALFWTSTEKEEDASQAYRWSIGNNSLGMSSGADYKDCGLSVRCLRNENGGSGGDTPAQMSAVITDNPTNVSSTSATFNGIITNSGNAGVTERGFVYGVGTVITDTVQVTGLDFVFTAGNLTHNTEYSVKAYIINSSGTSYGRVVNFTTAWEPQPWDGTGCNPNDARPCNGTPTVTDHEGNVYNTVQIGTQCWTKENMRCKTSPSTGNVILDTNTYIGYYWPVSYVFKKAYYVYGDSTNAPVFGLRYNWNAAMDTFNANYGETSYNGYVPDDSYRGVSVTFSGHRRGICPQGWHVPSDSEWTQLANYVNSQEQYQCDGTDGYIARALVAPTGWESNSSAAGCRVANSPTNNQTGFTAINTGGNKANFWTATQADNGNAQYSVLPRGVWPVLSVEWMYKSEPLSVRCLRNENEGINPPTPPQPDCSSYHISISGDTSICSGESTTLTAFEASNYNWSNGSNTVSITVSPAATTTYSVTGTNSEGCTATASITVTVNPATHNSITETACESYTWHEQTYTQSGDYTYNYTNEQGCPCTETLNLTINHGSHNVFTETAEGSYTWHEQTYTESGTYTYTYTNASGCASVDTLHLTVTSNSPTPPTPPSDTIADGYPCPNAHTVTDHEGNVYNTVQIGNQCWMKENMRCTTSPTTGTMFLETSPNGTSYTGKKAYYVNGNPDNTLVYGLLYNWNAAVDTFNTAYGETSTNSNSSYAVSITFSRHRRGICPWGWHVPSDAEWTQLTDYVSSQAQYVCGSNGDNIAKALASETGWSYNSNSCGVGNSPTNNSTGFTAVPAGFYNGGFNHFGIGMDIMSVTQVESGNHTNIWYRYLFTQVNPAGMTRISDHYKNQGLSVRCLRDTGTVNGGGSVDLQPDCSSYSINISGNTVLCSGESTTFTASETSSYSWSNGSSNASITVSPTATTTYSVTGTNSQGCTATASITVTVNSATNNSITETACESYTWHGQTYTQSGTYTYAYTNDNGCSSTDTLFLTIYNGTHNVETETACNSYTWHGTNYTESGTYTYNYTNGDGCSSVDTLFLTINNGSHNVETETACNSYTWHGQTYTQSGTYTYSYTNDNGCASVDTLFLTIYNGTHNTYTESAEGSYTWHEQTYTTSGTYIYTYNNENDCPSVDTLHLTVSSVTPIIPTDTLVDGQPCPGTPTVTDHEGNVYNTVQIGSQCWTKENMRCTTSPKGYLRAGDTLSYSVPYYFDDNTSPIPLADRGLLYNWVGALDTTANANYSLKNRRGICPVGWHVPQDGEWGTLVKYVSSQSNYLCNNNTSNIGKALASTQYWTETTNSNQYCFVGYNQSANNATGFSAVPAGCFNGSEFVNSGIYAQFCSSSSGMTKYLWSRKIINNEREVTRIYSTSKRLGLSVRCLKDTVPAIGSDTLCIGTHNVEMENACENYTWHGQTYTQSGTYTYAYTNDGGCASVDTLFLTIYNGTNNTFTESAEASYTWHEQTYTTSGTYIYAYNNDNGCPSMDTLFLTIFSNTPVLPIILVEDSLSCPGVPRVADHEGNIYNTVKIGNQCWTKENMRCTTSPSTGSSLLSEYSTAASKSASWHSSNTSYDSAYGLLYNWCAAVDTFLVTGGAPEVANATSSLKLYSTFNGYRRGICPIGWHVPSEQEWLQLLTYVYNQSFLCDDCHNPHLEDYNVSCIAKAMSSTTGWKTDNDECAVGYNMLSNNATGFNALPAGRYASGSYSSFGNYTYFWSSTEDYDRYSTWAYYTNWGYYYSNVERGETPKACKFSVRCVKDTTSTHDGGNPNPCIGSHNEESGSACNSYNWRGKTYTASGKYVYAYVNAQGCPSADTLHLVIHKPTITTNSAAACESYNWHGQTLTESGTHTHNYENEFGCASTETLNLIIYHGTHEVFTAEDCESYTWHGTTYSASGKYTYAYTNDHGCPSMDTLYLAIKDHVNLTTAAGACEEYNWRGQTLTASGSYTADFTNDHGCSCTETLNLTIYHGTGTTYTETACTRYNWHDSIYDKNGEYTYAYSDEHGCPSVDTLRLTIGNPCAGTPTVTDHQGNVYNTVQIGSQCWTKENMRCTTSPSTGTNLLSSDYPDTLTYSGKMAYYVNHDPSTAATYGLLYNWNAAVDVWNQDYSETHISWWPDSAVNITFSGHRRGICPLGWHVPSDAEWTQMINYVKSQSEYVCGNSSDNIAKALAIDTGWATSTIYEDLGQGYYDLLDSFGVQVGGECAVCNNQSSNNATCFSALPAGYYYGTDNIWNATGFDPNSSANFFSSTQMYQDDPNVDSSFSNMYIANAYGYGIFHFGRNVVRSATTKRYGNSVRCVKNE